MCSLVTFRPLYTLKRAYSLFAHRSRGRSQLLGIFTQYEGAQSKKLEPEPSTFQWFGWLVVAEVLYVQGAFNFDPKKTWFWNNLLDPMESPFVLDGASNGVSHLPLVLSLMHKIKQPLKFHPSMWMTIDVSFSSEFLKMFSYLVSIVIDLLPLQTCPRCLCWFLVAREFSIRARGVREDGNEEGRLTGRTRFRSGGIGWRICPIGRLQQRQERWSILLQNSHWGLMSPRQKAAFPSETEREKRGGEEREQAEGWNDGGMKIPQKNPRMECERE